MQATQQAAHRGGAVQAPPAGLGELTIDDGQHLAAVLVQAGADQARRGGEASLLQVAQQRMHRRCPVRSVTDHHVAPAVDD
jgi:hypothetical protein